MELRVEIKEKGSGNKYSTDTLQSVRLRPQVRERASCKISTWGARQDVAFVTGGLGELADSLGHRLK